jgi:hypothetical protein
MKFHWRRISNILDTDFPTTDLLCILNWSPDVTSHDVTWRAP